MIAAALIFAGLAALLHVYIWVMESFLWTAPRTRAAFGTTAEEAETTKLLAYNQGFYNLFLAIVTIVGIVIGRGRRAATTGAAAAQPTGGRLQCRGGGRPVAGGQAGADPLGVHDSALASGAPGAYWKYANIILSRWITPIAPIFYAGIGCTVSVLWARLGTHRARYALAALVAVLVLRPLLLLEQHYETATRRGETDEEPLRQAQLLAISREPDEQVVIDATLQNYGLEDGGTVSKALRYALTVGSLPTIRSDVSADRLSAIMGSDGSVLLATGRRKASELQSEFALSPLDVTSASSDTHQYAVYRVTRR